MLERIREGLNGPWAIAIVALIVVSFVFTGVGGYLNSSASTAIAVVNEEEISLNSLEIAMQNERIAMERRFGEAVSSLFANEQYLADFRAGILDRLIADALIAQKAKELGLRVSDEQIKEAIVQMPEFQIAGQFSNESYQMSIQRAGYTPSEFAEYMRVQLTRSQLRQAINGSTISINKAVEDLLKLQKQTRDASYIEVSSSNYIDEVTVTDEEIQAYYDANISQYDTEEKVRLAFISLSVDNLLPRVEVSEDEIQAYYQENIGYFQTPEERAVAHILFETSEDAQSRAEAALERLNNGEDFATLAEELSDDFVSAEEGGLLGVVEEGDYEDSFMEAVFALEAEGDYSGIVETEFGYHIIQMTSYQPLETDPLEQVREQIFTDLKRDKAIEEFYALQSEIERIAFESSDDLAPIAELIDRPVLETNLFGKNNLPASVNFPQVENVAFSPELTEDKVNSELLSISENEVMVVRVVEHQPQRTMSLDEVSADIRIGLTNEKAQQAAYQWAQEVQNSLMENDNADDLLAEKSLSWKVLPGLARNNAEVSRNVTEALFALSTIEGNKSAVVNLNNGNVGVIKLDKINPVEALTEEEITQYKGRYASQQAQRTFENFVEALKADADISITN
ncbi:SurA N-terminal domain-containing protein [Glaciecola sp. 1036]|uniref:SurA N-terminal domain-containing protein n=1 Tax=Alteromonadaceae TaxID=72275 RepID=UPI003D01AC18